MMNKIKKKTMKESIGERIFEYGVTAFYILFSFLCMYPFYYIFINVLSDPDIAQRGEVMLYVKGFTLAPIKDVFKIKGVFSGLLVSIGRTLIATILTLVVSVYAGYCFSKREMWCRKILYRLIVMTMYFSAGLIPGYLNAKSLGLLNNPLIYFTGCFHGAYNLVLTKTYIESGIPDSLEEAAIMDGGGYFVRLIKIIFPLSKPVMGVIAVFTAVAHWNDYITYILYIRSTTWRPLQALLYTYLTKVDMLIKLLRTGQISSEILETVEEATTSVVIARYAITVVSVLPVLIIYPVCQKYFEKGLMIGAVKG